MPPLNQCQGLNLMKNNELEATISIIDNTKAKYLFEKIYIKVHLFKYTIYLVYFKTQKLTISLVNIKAVNMELKSQYKCNGKT